MNWKECKQLISADLDRLAKIKFGGIRYLFSNASFRITFWFRIGSYLQTKSGLLYKILYTPVFLIHKHNQYLTGIQLPIGTQIGKGLCFSHFSCIVINRNCKIGDYCTIFQGVTIGSVRGSKGGVPEIGNNVVICSGCQIVGNVKIGNNTIIGAGGVVVNDIPENSVAVGVPARVASKDGFINTQYYIR